MPTAESKPLWKRRVLWAWLLVAIWAATIWSLGGDQFSAGQTGSLLRRIMNFLMPQLSPRDLLALHFWVRKWAHVFEYAVLAWLTYRAARIARIGSFARASALALALVSVLAIADEVRQSYSPLRTGSPRDVALDIGGGAIAIALNGLIARIAGRGQAGPDA